MAEPQQQGLLQLPQNVLRMIALQSDHVRNGKLHSPLLRVSVGGRSAVLGKASKIALDVGPSDHAASSAPLCRMLSRACSQAAPGVRLKLNGKGAHENRQDSLLASLLEPGLRVHRGSGWPNVHHLKLHVSSSVFVLAAPADSAAKFPA
jgi:hypothetical protein